jgi:hypothetical protein
MAEVDDGTIVGMDGLTTRRTRHGLVLDGVELWTWCAYDIVGIAAALEAEAIGRTRYGACERRRSSGQACPTNAPAVSWPHAS